MQFINFILQPRRDRRCHQHRALPERGPGQPGQWWTRRSVRDDPNVYPDAKALERSFTVAAVPQARGARDRTRLWERFKAGH